MAQKLLPSLEEMRDRVDQLSRLQKLLLDKINVLEEENKDLKKELEAKEKLLAKAETDIEFLTVSHHLAANPDALISVRRRIARLIRTIDSCMEMLHEE